MQMKCYLESFLSKWISKMSRKMIKKWFSVSWSVYNGFIKAILKEKEILKEQIRAYRFAF